MPAILPLLLQIVPLIPRLIEAGQATFSLYDTVKRVIDENRSPTQPEWDELERMINGQRAALHDTSRDV